MTDRADRLSSRRKDRSEQQGEPAEPEQPAQEEESTEQQGSIKDQYQGTYIYLPPELRREFDLIADEMDTQRRRRNGKQVEKIRHFEPLVVALGLEQIEEMDDDELEDCLAEFDP